MSGYGVPVDIVEQILHRLPPKSIGKCMAVCKSWNLLIKSHHFLYSYQHRSLSSTPPFLIKTSHYQYHCLSSVSNMIESSFSLTPKDDEYKFVGAVNGLVCLTSYEKRNFIVFNPLTRRSIRFPMSQTLCNSNIDFELVLEFGFGFNSKKNDFKVLHIPYTNDCKVELYSLNEGAWRVLNNTPFRKHVDRYYWQQLFFQDSVHWLAYGTTSDNHHIVMFNVVEEKFSEMELPEVLARSYWKLNMTVIDGCLSVIQYDPQDNTNIWMKRESWSKIYSLSLSGADIIMLWGQNMSSQVLILPFFWSNLDSNLMSLHSYDLKSQEMRDLGVKSDLRAPVFTCAPDFTYSLILLDKESYADVSSLFTIHFSLL